jgi:beta-glucosidase
MFELLAKSFRRLGLLAGPIGLIRLIALIGLLISLFIASDGWAAESDETRVEKILDQMTLQEKLDYIGGVNAMSIRPIPRLGVPETRMSDGPLGVRRDTPSTRYPGGVALAASWNRALATMEGPRRSCLARSRRKHQPPPDLWKEF